MLRFAGCNATKVRRRCMVLRKAGGDASGRRRSTPARSLTGAAVGTGGTSCCEGSMGGGLRVSSGTMGALCGETGPCGFLPFNS